MSIALVTGAARGLGTEVARQLVTTGVEVVIGARDPQAAAAAVSELDGVRSYAESLDIADPESVHRAAMLWADDIGVLDILINNAAAYVDWSELASTADLEAAERVMQVNLFGSWRMIQAFLPLLKRSAHPRIVNVSSGAGSYADPAFGLPVRGGAAATYGISKAALNALTSTLAADLAATPVIVNAVCPGLTATYPGAEAMGGASSGAECGGRRVGGHAARRRAARWVLPRWKAFELVAACDALNTGMVHPSVVGPRIHSMSAVSIPSHEVRAGARLWRRLLVVAAVGQAVSSTLVSVFGGAFTTADRAGEPPIVPPGGTFIIWNVIIVLSIGYAIWAESDQRPNLALRNRLTRPLLVTCIGFSVWLAAAELEPIWSTVAVFLIMLAGLIRALTYAQEERTAIRAWNPLAQVLLWGTLGLYTGWSSVAVWLNLTTALVGSGLPITTPAAIVGQAAILAGAVGTAVAITWFTRGLLPYVATIAWALGGVIVSTVQEGYPVLATTAGLGLAIVLATAVLARRRAGQS